MTDLTPAERLRKMILDASEYAKEIGETRCLGRLIDAQRALRDKTRATSHTDHNGRVLTRGVTGQEVLL